MEWETYLFLTLYLLGIGYIIFYRYQLKVSVEKIRNALDTNKIPHFQSIRIPVDWKEMEQLEKRAKGYRLAHWLTIGLISIMTTILFLVIKFKSLDEISLLMLSFVLSLHISSVLQRGNFYLLPDGLVINSMFYSWDAVQLVRVEKIVKWHELYGLDDAINDGFKLTVRVKRKLFQPQYIVVTEEEELNEMVSIFEKHHIVVTVQEHIVDGKDASI
ncbi:hypothetical protein [Bacillus sp. FJAT-47783]|uniref:hypothetical protein n=1 Tax=Bacillus sp. FJAT-47783 TaxID=2922712 RepID=UPI001FAE446A|nr:hypothetical protein [Bacillus sp. FJAT-47783]